MSHIIHYIIALTFTFLGLQLQKQEKVENICVLSKKNKRNNTIGEVYRKRFFKSRLFANGKTNIHR